MSIEDRSLSPSEARSRILLCFKKKRPVFLWGPPGVGKSDVVASITEELKGIMYDVRLGQMEPTDIRGIPFFNKEEGVMDWAPPVDLPDEETASQYDHVVLFLDEMNSAAPSVQAAAYQLILNRRIGKYKLPDNVVVIAAGNRDSDKGVTYRMPAPLKNRFVHLNIRADFDSWQDWAIRNGIHSDVVGYLSYAKNKLTDFDPRSPSNAFATPRSWTFVSDFIHDETATDAELMDLISGTIGEGLAGEFMAHRKMSAKMPNPEDVLDGKVTTLETDEISAMYSLTIALCYELQDRYNKLGKENIDKWYPFADNFLTFIMENFTTELAVMGARVALSTYDLPMIPGKVKSIQAFYERFGKYILGTAAKR